MPFIIIPVSIVILGILGIAHAVVYGGLITIVSILCPGFLTWPMIDGLRIIFVILTLSFTGMTILTFYWNNIVTRVAYRISAIWTGFLMYFFFAAFAYGAFIFAGNNFSASNHVLFSYLSYGFLSEIGLALYVLALLIGVYGVFHANTILVTNVSVKLPAPNPTLPGQASQSWKGKKAVWISDIHLGSVRGVKFMEKIVKKIQALKPDMVFIGGDLFDGPKIDEIAAVAPLRGLCMPADPSNKVKNGVYFIMGNHEEFSEKSAPRFLNAVKGIPGMRVLEDEFVTVDGVDIIGVDHGRTDNAEKFSAVMKKIKTGMEANMKRPSILLKHEPRDLDIAVATGVSFQISGHTHKGQVFPATLLADLVFPGCNYGLHERILKNAAGKEQKMQIYTSSGVGTWGPPLRVGTRSEIVLFDFQ